MNIFELNQHTEPTPPAVGDWWEGQGGWYAGVIRDTDTNERWHLIVADAEVKGQWGGYGKEIDGANSATDGHQNTLAMLATGSDAAIKAASHRADDHTDFYVPSQKEQNISHANLSDKYSKAWHLSSTQYSTTTAWMQDFEDGYQDFGSKNDSSVVRPVRRITINGGAA